MRAINNRQEPAKFEKWRNKNQTAKWDVFRHTSEYSELKQHLIDTQEMMCCYCEIAITDPANTQLEHVKCKDKYWNDRFVFENLYACCQYTDSCGHLKGNREIDNMILPNGECVSRFTFTNNGRIIPAKEQDFAAVHTIDLLGLNSKRLIDMRKNVIRALDDVEEISLLNAYLQNCVDWLNGFKSVVEYVILKTNN